MLAASGAERHIGIYVFEAEPSRVFSGLAVVMGTLF